LARFGNRHSFDDPTRGALSPHRPAGENAVGGEGIPYKKLPGFPALDFTQWCEHTVIILLTRLFSSGLRVSKENEQS
jgi:hypothetical protein